jgi:hypothetical protein
MTTGVAFTDTVTTTGLVEYSSGYREIQGMQFDGVNDYINL